MVKHAVKAGKITLFLLIMVTIARLIDPSQYISNEWVLTLTALIYGEDKIYAEYTENIFFYLNVIEVIFFTAIVYMPITYAIKKIFFKK